jgi:hypothetical protein
MLPEQNGAQAMPARSRVARAIRLPATQDFLDSRPDVPEACARHDKDRRHGAEVGKQATVTTGFAAESCLTIFGRHES